MPLCHKNFDDCLNQMEIIHFPLGGRSDHDIPPLGYVKTMPCKYSKLKYCICALRRGKTEFWPLFNNLVSSNAEEFSKNLNNRWIISIADTYVDYGAGEEKLTATIMTSMSFILTLANCIYFGQNKNDPKQKILGSVAGVPYSTYFIFGERSDFFENAMKRISKTAKNSSIMSIYYKRFIENLKACPDSLIGYVFSLNFKKFISS